MSERRLTSSLLPVSRPVVALRQWKSEIEAHSEGLKVLIWHGQGRDKNSMKDLKKYNIILTRLV
jgi:DNA repair protein RAD16